MANAPARRTIMGMAGSGMDARSKGITELVRSARRGDQEATDKLFDAIYEELKVIARSVPGVGRPGDTMQATVLTNEVFVQLSRRFPPPPESLPESRATFYRSVALAMRKLVYEHARAAAAAKRGGGRAKFCLDEDRDDLAARVEQDLDHIALDEALSELENFHNRWYQVVIHKYFGGRTNSEVATLLGCSISTVASDWSFARAWLFNQLKR